MLFWISYLRCMCRAVCKWDYQESLSLSWSYEGLFVRQQITGSWKYVIGTWLEIMAGYVFLDFICETVT